MQDGDCELSKEDIQPLKQGRVMSSLQAALAPQCQEDLTQKRREFEEELRTSSGVTLLDVYHRYVLWLEQHHVTTSVNMPQLLEQAIVQFKTNTELFNDVRYVGIWIRYAMMSPEPLATFKAMFEAGIGDQHAEFYATWAQQLEASGDTCGASRVLQGAIHRRATPTSRLEAALGHLEARVSCQATLTYAASKSFDLKVTSTPCATDHTVPKVGEDFTVGGLTALVQDLAILSRSASSAAQIPPVEPLEPPQQVEQQQPSQPGVPLSPKTDTAAPLATRRFSIAAAVDLSTIYECSKEGKSSSNSGGSTCSSSSSSHHLAAGSTLSTTARPTTGGNLPAVQGEPDNDGGVSLVAAAMPEQSQEQGEEGEQAVRAVASEDPFSEEMRSIILASWQPQKSDQRKLLESPAKRPIVKGNALITLGDHKIRVLRRVASGAYAAVYLAQMIKTEETYLDDDESFEAPSQGKVVLKVGDNNGNARWESYICCELHRRLSETSEAFTKHIVDLQLACFFSNGAISVFPYSPHGTLLDLVTQFKKHCCSSVPECLVLYFTLEFITILQQVHLCGIIHADIKPDNVLIKDLPSKAGFLDKFFTEGPSCLQLIDFGRAIDMSQLPSGTAFSYVVTTEGFVCTEMRDNRQWTFQTDWFGLLGCLHVLLFGHYMKVEKKCDGTWGIGNKFKRYWQQELWNRLFSTLLNIASCSELPDLNPFVLEIQSLLRNKSRAHSVNVEALRAKNF